EASCHMASTLGRKFSIVTGGHRWGPMLEEFVEAIGLADNLASVRTVAPSGDEIAAKPEAALAGLIAACTRAAEDDGAEIVILGGLGLAGLAELLADKVPVPVVDNVVAGIRVAEAAAALGVAKARTGSFAPAAPIKTRGLSAQLASLIEGSGEYRSAQALAGVQSKPSLPPTQDEDGCKRQRHYSKRNRGRQRTQRVDHGRCHSRRLALQLQGQRIEIADSLASASNLVPRQGEAEEADAHHTRTADGQHHVAQGLPARGTEIARRLRVPGTEPV